MDTTNSGNARALRTAIVEPRDGTVACRIVTDCQHRGTLFAWNGEWVVTDLENRKFLGTFDRLAIVSLDMDDAEAADTGLNQTAIGFDLDDGDGEWVINADDLEDLRATYGDKLVVVWVQDETPA